MKCFLIGSPVSVASFWARIHNSLFWSEAASNPLRVCAADNAKTSVADLLPNRWTKKSSAEAALAFEISNTFSPQSGPLGIFGDGDGYVVLLQTAVKSKPGVILGAANTTSYCLRSTVGTKSWYKRGPGGDIVTAACTGP